MQIQFGNVWLAHKDFPAFDVHVDGQLAVQEEDFLRATTAKFYARGNRKLRVTFQTHYRFDSRQKAEEFLLAHTNDLPNQADAVFYCGSGETSTQATLANAVLTLLPEMDWKDSSVRVKYSLAGGAVTGVQAVAHVADPFIPTNPIIHWTSVPSTASSPGTVGQMAYASNGFLYLCVALNSWVRTPMARW